MNRDDYFRCPVCKKLFTNEECSLDLDKGYKCPNGCEKPFIQPQYESPTQDD